MSSLAKKQRLFRNFIDADQDLTANINEYVVADEIHDRNPCRATKRPLNRLEHQHYQRLHRRDSAWLRLLTFLTNTRKLP